MSRARRMRSINMRAFDLPEAVSLSDGHRSAWPSRCIITLLKRLPSRGCSMGLKRSRLLSGRSAGGSGCGRGRGSRSSFGARLIPAECVQASLRVSVLTIKHHSVFARCSWRCVAEGRPGQQACSQPPVVLRIATRNNPTVPLPRARAPVAGVVPPGKPGLHHSHQPVLRLTPGRAAAAPPF